MDDLNKFIQSIGILAEMASIIYHSLLTSELSEDVAVTLTAKIIGELTRAVINKSQEDEHE